MRASVCVCVFFFWGGGGGLQYKGPEVARGEIEGKLCTIVHTIQRTFCSKLIWDSIPVQ